MADTAAEEAEATEDENDQEKATATLGPDEGTTTVDSDEGGDDRPFNRTASRRRFNADDTGKSVSHRRSRSDPAHFRKYLADLAARALEDKAAGEHDDSIGATDELISSLRQASGKDETSSPSRRSGMDSSSGGVSFELGANNVSPSPSGRPKAIRRFSNPSSGLGASISSIATTATFATSKRMKVYRSSLTDKKTTRVIAALDFLLGIPLEAEQTIVQHGWMLQQQRKQAFRNDGTMDEEEDDDDPYGSDEDTQREEITPLEPPGSSVATTAQLASQTNSHHGRWWEKWVPREATITDGLGGPMARGSPQKGGKDSRELELPTASTMLTAGSTGSGVLQHGTPGRDNTFSFQSTATHASGGPSQQQPHQLYATRGTKGMPTAPTYAPGRRLEGDEAVLVQIPLKVDTITKQKDIALQAAIREWEIKVAHGLMGEKKKGNDATPTQNHRQQQPLLDGRLFFSASGSYPMAVFSIKKYEPQREEAAQRRMKLEARGGGGSHFVMPSRDWRGITFRALLPRKAVQARNQKAFNRFLEGGMNTPKRSHSTGMHRSPASNWNPSLDERSMTDDDDTDSESSVSSSSSAEDAYIPGILDDPEMVLGRHRNVMIGDYVTGCIVASTIQFVKPTLLKADLNQKFRQRFDGWEPNKSQRKYIGACVINGIYTLVDPTDNQHQQAPEDASGEAPEPTVKFNLPEPLQATSAATPSIIRMPPSLTLSKIRNAKRQALMAFVNANLEIGTVALAFVYFERLCLSCRVDKSNRRLCFASCLLLACKINEPNEVLVMKEDTNVSEAESGDEDERKNMNARKKIKRLQSSIRPSKRSSSMFASLLGFFTEVWALSLEHLFAAEWGVFAALRFSLHATPSQVAFHFKRIMKTLEWNPGQYLGPEMFAQWQEALATEERLKLARERRHERRRIRKERQLERELHEEIRGKHQMHHIAEKDPQRKRVSSKVKSAHLLQRSEIKAQADKEAREKKLDARKNSGSVAIDIPLEDEVDSEKETSDQDDDEFKTGLGTVI